MKSGVQVGDAMTMSPVSVEPGMSLVECAKIMSDKHVGAVVVKKNSQSIGILTEKDIVRKAVAQSMNTNNGTVEEFMQTNLITINPDKDIYDALIKMRDNNIRHLPVVEKDIMVGLLTIKDILKLEPQLFDLIVEKFELREESRKLINRIVPTEGICQVCGEYSEKVKEIKGAVVCGNCSKEETVIA